MKKPVCVLLLLCSATMACYKEEPYSSRFGGKRQVEARLSGQEGNPCCEAPEPISSCAAGSAKAALALLPDATGDCLEKVVNAVKKHAPDDLAAAYLIRAERKNDPVDYLRALSVAKGFNQALAQEKLFLTKEAIASWDEVVKSEKSAWAEEAKQRRDRLTRSVLEPTKNSPAEAMRDFERSNVLDLETSRPLAEALLAAGDRYAHDIVKAVERPKDQQALEQGVRAFQEKDYEKAVKLLKQAGNPLYLSAQYRVASNIFFSGDPLPILEQIAPIATKDGYRDLATRIYTLRAGALELSNRYFTAHEAYEQALLTAQKEPTATVEALNRRSQNYSTIGKSDLAFRDALDALSRLPGVTSVKERHLTYASAATAASRLGYPEIALQFQNAAIDEIRKGVINAPLDGLARSKHQLSVALRARAEIRIQLERDNDAKADLQEAVDLAESANLDKPTHQLLQMRLHEVTGQTLLKNDPQEAAKRFTAAIALAEKQDSTYRAVLHFKRAVARRRAEDPDADEDVRTALKILRDEAVLLRNATKRGEFENLWTPYFSRFQSMHHDLVESRLAANDVEGAFLYAEQARAFEPMHLLLQSRSVPPGFQKIETTEHLQRALAALPEDTVILQYLVLADKTYTFVLTRGRIQVFRQRAARKDIAEWLAQVTEAVEGGQSFTGTMRAVYTELFRAPLAAAPGRKRVVIIPDGPMHGLPFAGLQGTKEEGYLIERAIIETAGSTSLYLYALARDRQFRPDPRPRVLAVGDPSIDPNTQFKPLEYAREEAKRLARDFYPGAEVLTGDEATAERFLESAKTATIIHFAGHGIANAQNPSASMLLLAYDELTAEELMTGLSELESARLVVLGACSTAGGQPVGPEGLAPLVRPLIAANVPAVVGTLWKVNDATAANLLVSLHCHYRHGDDVAVALRNAQLERLRKNDPAMTWAAFQLVGYAGSPFARRVALEEPHSEHVCTQNSLHRPDGLHPQ